MYIQFEKRQPDSTRLILSCLPKNYKLLAVMQYVNRGGGVNTKIINPATPPPPLDVNGHYFCSCFVHYYSINGS